ncbi:hypothetical protein [Vannielia sp.]|nr:hypothetical protein [Vannielia sp.]MDF1873958.1 hypothetical protein [Vannielia sp.]
MIHGDCHDAFGLIRDTCGFQGEQGFRALGCIHAIQPCVGAAVTALGGKL